MNDNDMQNLYGVRYSNNRNPVQLEDEDIYFRSPQLTDNHNNIFNSGNKRGFGNSNQKNKISAFDQHNQFDHDYNDHLGSDDKNKVY